VIVDGSTTISTVVDLSYLNPVICWNWEKLWLLSAPWASLEGPLGSSYVVLDCGEAFSCCNL
jgi:hypothetical protein